jgi:TonB family protein
MRKYPATRAGAFGALFLLFAVIAMVQFSPRLAAQSSSGDAPRKVRVAVKPEYPELARRSNLSGTVRVEVVIGPDGKVKRTRIVGGHPVLCQDAQRAAMMTEFEPAPKETTQVLEYRFGEGN